MSQNLLDESYQQNERPPSYCFRQENWRTFFCELIGTAILVTGNTVMLHDLYVLVSLYTARIMFAPLTGGYFNTAVTLGVFLNKNSGNKISAKRLLFYITGQLIGATIGVTISKVVYDVNVGPFDSLTPYSSNDVIVRCFGELIGATIFVLMVLILTTSDTTFISEQCWVHLFVPIFLYGGRKYLFSHLSKNVKMVTSLFSDNGDPSHVGFIFAIAGSELLGAAIAAKFFNLVYYPMLLKWRSQE